MDLDNLPENLSTEEVFPTAAMVVAERLLKGVPEIDGITRIGLAGVTQPESDRINTRLFVSRRCGPDGTFYSFGDDWGYLAMGVTWSSGSSDVYSFSGSETSGRARTAASEDTKSTILEQLQSSVPFNPATHLVLRLPSGDRIVRRNLFTRMGKLLGF